ncbi:phosphopantetheine-binding protein [Streptomyces sp. SM11]|uniref:phosphopantetheine-binding protein n=1 Tax=Bacteria TaxID=2 RepID=UPI001C93602C|nr:phosphopantetheine-binding protein [Streptomyces sp. SM11]
MMGNTAAPSPVFAAIAAEVARLAEIPVGSVLPHADLRDDLDLDSLSMVELLAVVEDRYGCVVPDEEAERIRTVTDLVALVEVVR